MNWPKHFDLQAGVMWVCGIPILWGDDNNTAYLTGAYEGSLIQPNVLLYDSHLRLGIKGQAPHGSQVEVVLYQQNPILDYYFVEVKEGGRPTEGWVPAPFLSFEPVDWSSANATTP